MEKKPYNIAFIVPSLLNEYNRRQWYALDSAVREKGDSLFVITPLIYSLNKVQAEEALDFLKLPSPLEFDGYIYTVSSLQNFYDSQSIDLLFERMKGKPFVTIGYECPFGCSVLMDNYSGVSSMTEHFIKEHQYTKIGFVKGPERNDEAEIRFKAFKETMKKYGLPLNDQWVFQGDFGSPTAESSMHSFLASGQEPPEALIAANDDSAIGVIKAMDDFGLEVGKDLAVGGFDNNYVAAEKGLTTVDQPIDVQLRTALDQLYRILSGESVDSIVRVPATPVIRNTCGCLPESESPGDSRDQGQEKKRYLSEDIGGYNIGFVSQFFRDNSAVLTMEDFRKAVMKLFSSILIKKSSIFFFDEGLPVFTKDSILPNNGGKLFLKYDEKADSQQDVPSEIFFLSELTNIKESGMAQSLLVTDLLFQKEHFGYMVLDLHFLDPFFIVQLKKEIESTLHNMYIQNELNSSLETLKQLLSDNRNFVNVLAHDIKNPLNQIFMSLDMIKSLGTLNTRQLEFADRAKGSIHMCSGIITDLLSLQRFKNEDVDIIKTVFSVDECCSGVYDEFAGKAEEKGLFLDYRKDLRNNKIVCNQEMLKSVIRNLLSNAVKFSKSGESICLKVETDDMECRIIVEDQGPGFSPSDLEKLYSAFTPLSAKPTASEKSTGLGLSLVKILVDRLGGWIELKTDLGKGSRFTVTIPLLLDSLAG